MWPYSFVTRAEFEKRKDFVDLALRGYGCVVEQIQLPYIQSETTYGRHFEETWISERPVYRLGNQYIRICEVLFQKPFVVLEIADTLADVLNNAMEDTDPFPYDLSDDQILEEVRLSLGIEKSPDS